MAETAAAKHFSHTHKPCKDYRSLHTPSHSGVAVRISESAHSKFLVSLNPLGDNTRGVEAARNFKAGGCGL